MQSSAPVNLLPVTTRPEHQMAAHIRDAAEVTGVPFEFLLAQAKQESRLNPDAKSQRSSAMGLFQFTSGTWMDMIKKHGTDHGLEKYADSIVRGTDGRWTVQDKALKKKILDLRKDPRLSALMAAEYAKDNEKILEAKLGREVSTHDLYLAHFLGAGGALRVLRGRGQETQVAAAAQTGEQGSTAEGGEVTATPVVATSDTQPPMTFLKAAKANPGVFHDPASGEARSMDSVYASIERRFKRSMADASRLMDEMTPKVDLASLKPEARPDPTVQIAQVEEAPQAPAQPPSLGALYGSAKRQLGLAMTEYTQAAKDATPKVDLAAMVAKLHPPAKPGQAPIQTAEAPAPQKTEPLSAPQQPVLADNPALTAKSRLGLAEVAPPVAIPEEPTQAQVAAVLPTVDTAAELEVESVRPLQAAEADLSAGSTLALTMADIPADTSAFPTRLPPRPLKATPASFPVSIQPGQDAGQNGFPVPIPPPLSGARADTGTTSSMIAMVSDEE